VETYGGVYNAPDLEILASGDLDRPVGSVIGIRGEPGPAMTDQQAFADKLTVERRHDNVVMPGGQGAVAQS
jgi:hypothetical protein